LATLLVQDAWLAQRLRHSVVQTAYACDPLLSATAAVLAVTVASELAATRADVSGPGTFLPALIDELAHLTPEIIQKRAKVEVL
jgi:hydroxyethylthiazole kinase-like sugar kinase family protein